MTDSNVPVTTDELNELIDSARSSEELVLARPVAEATLRELSELRDFKLAVGYLALSLDPEHVMAEGAPSTEAIRSSLHKILAEVGSDRDWVTDPRLTPAEVKERFERLQPVTVSEPQGRQARAEHIVDQVNIVRLALASAVQHDLIDATSAKEQAELIANTLKEVLSGQTSFGERRR